MGIFDRDWYRSLWFGGKHPPACTCCDCNEGVKRKSSREAQSVTDRLNQELLDKDKIKEGGIMANRQKQPPINLEEEEEPQEEGRGPISYAGGETEPRGSKLKVPKLVKRGPALGILQIFIPILVAVVISFLLINAMAVNKGTYSSGIGALQASVDGKIAAEDAKITNVINNYASKSEISGFVKAGDLSGYMRASDLSAVQQQVTTLQASVGSLSGGLTQAQVQAMITQALGSSATYVTKAQMDTAISAAVTYLRGLIGSEGVVNYSFLGSGDTYALLVGPSAAGNYTGEVNIT